MEKLKKTTLGPHPLCFILWWNVSEWVADGKGFQLFLVTCFSLTEMLVKDGDGHGPWISLDSSHGFRSNSVADLNMAFIKNTGLFALQQKAWYQVKPHSSQALASLPPFILSRLNETSRKWGRQKKILTLLFYQKTWRLTRWRVLAKITQLLHRRQGWTLWLVQNSFLLTLDLPP